MNNNDNIKYIFCGEKIIEVVESPTKTHWDFPDNNSFPVSIEEYKGFDTRAQCLQYALNVTKAKRSRYQVLENYLNAELIREVFGDIQTP